MADEGTAQTLVLVGAVLQLVMSIFFLGAGGFLIFLDLVVWTGVLTIISFVIFILGIPGLIFMILWFMWRSDACAHKTGLIVTGVLGLIFAGFLPGLLVLIGGIVCPGESA